MGKIIDLKGQRFGLLTVIEKSEEKSKSGFTWICECDLRINVKEYSDA